jgi:hypothetical protein
MSKLKYLAVILSYMLITISCKKEKVDFRDKWQGDWFLDCNQLSIVNGVETKTDYSLQLTNILKGDTEVNLYLESIRCIGNTSLPICNFNVSENGVLSVTNEEIAANTGRTVTGSFTDGNHLSFSIVYQTSDTTQTKLSISGSRDVK